MADKFLTMRLEDGESVIRLRGGRGLQRKSDRPHAGVWGKKTSYVLVPCRTRHQTRMRAALAVSSVEGITDRSSDAEVLVLGTHEAIERLITSGPAFCRALVSRAGQPRSEAQIAAAEKLRAAK